MKEKGKVTSKDVRNFIEGNINYLKNRSSFMKLDTYIKEQAICRAVSCLECLNKGACTECGCATPQMFYSPKKEDSKERWGEMMKEEEWEAYKKEHDLEVPNIDLAAIEVSNDYKDVDLLPPWELKELLNEISEGIEKDKDEAEG